MAERAYPEDPYYISKTKYYHAFIDRYEFGKKYTEGKVVLDVPCGSGWGASLIDNARKVYGVDISQEAIQYALSHFPGSFSLGSMCDLPFEDNKFDIALCFEGIEHITKEEGVIFINEIKRVVQRDGLIVGSVPILNKDGEDTGNIYHKFEYPEEYLKILLEENFDVIEFNKVSGGDGPIVFFVLKNCFKYKVTLITSSYNSNKVLKEAIDNVLNQTCKDFRLLIINNNSVGDNVEILNNYSDSRIKIVNYKFKQRSEFNSKLSKKSEQKNFLMKIKKFVRKLLHYFATNHKQKDRMRKKKFKN